MTNKLPDLCELIVANAQPIHHVTCSTAACLPTLSLTAASSAAKVLGSSPASDLYGPPVAVTKRRLGHLLSETTSVRHV
jgi:hypothetical protein